MIRSSRTARSHASLAHGELHAEEHASDLDQGANAAAVEAEEDALGDEETFDGLGVVSVSSIADERQHLVRVESAELTLGTVAEDTGHNDGGELGAATAEVADTTDWEKEPHPHAHDEQDGEEGVQHVEDGVEGEDDAPLGLESIFATHESGIGKATGVVIVDLVALAEEFLGEVTDSLDVVGLGPHAPVHAAEDDRDDQGQEAADHARNLDAVHGSFWASALHEHLEDWVVWLVHLFLIFANSNLFI